MRRAQLGLLSTLPLIVGAAVGAPPSVAVRTPQAFQDISSCVASNDRANFLMVIDESASLRDTDPQARRTGALMLALNGINRIKQSAPDKDIKVAASTFSTDYQQRVGWGSPDQGRLKSFIRDDVAKLNSGPGTDYRKALQGARQQLIGAGEGCRIMFWFTDGGLDVGDSSDAAKSSAYEDICDRSSIIDSLRGDGINVVALALFNKGGSVTESDRSRLKAIAEGSGANGSCGTVPLPERYARGAYIPVDDAGQLTQVFASAMARMAGYTNSVSVDCPDNTCINGALPFDVDTGIASVRIIANALQDGVRYSLTPPGGSAVDVAEGEQEVGSVPVETVVSDGTTQIDLNVGESGTGRWEVTAVGGPAQINLWFRPNVTLALADAEQTLSGEEPTQVEVVARTGDVEFDKDVYSSAKLQASVNGEPVMVKETEAGWALEVPQPVGDLPPSRKLDVQLSLVTKPSQVVLDPVKQSFNLRVTASAAYPQIVSEELVFPEAQKPGPQVAEVQLNGSALGASRVCLNEAQLVGPAGEIAVAPEGGTIVNGKSCVDLAQDQLASMRFSADPGEIVDGKAQGDAKFTLVSSQAGNKELTQVVPASMGISRPINQAVRGLTFWLLLMAAAAIPFLLVYWLGKKQAKFHEARGPQLRYAKLPVQVSYDSLNHDYQITNPASSTLSVNPDEHIHNQTVGIGQEREFSLDKAPISFSTDFVLIAWKRMGPIRVPLLEFRPTAKATLTSQGMFMASNASPYVFDGKTCAIRPTSSLSLHDCRFLIVAPGAADKEIFSATLVALTRQRDFNGLNDQINNAGKSITGRMVEGLKRLRGSGRAGERLATVAASAPRMSSADSDDIFGDTSRPDASGSAGPTSQPSKSRDDDWF